MDGQGNWNKQDLDQPQASKRGAKYKMDKSDRNDSLPSMPATLKESGRVRQHQHNDGTSARSRLAHIKDKSSDFGMGEQPTAHTLLNPSSRNVTKPMGGIKEIKDTAARDPLAPEYTGRSKLKMDRWGMRHKADPSEEREYATDLTSTSSRALREGRPFMPSMSKRGGEYSTSDWGVGGSDLSKIGNPYRQTQKGSDHSHAGSWKRMPSKIASNEILSNRGSQKQDYFDRSNAYFKRNRDISDPESKYVKGGDDSHPAAVARALGVRRGQPLIIPNGMDKMAPGKAGYDKLPSLGGQAMDEGSALPKLGNTDMRQRYA
eukprot:CAMPEP_0184317214 /NCGR_PEP_ID=MMETSP1049-20130417/95300_1 /TAXON_ID=77928 /ORGANISM="Proteomonas sulcata, Strain CCMP704" /LENGTH=317 /DNA_ID=CAMNT_0026636525 /DNA_START=1 /DNA_END=954 /DNA_ORIENTATION=+